MKKVVHLADSRGLTDNGWLHGYHSFSFGDYYDPQRVHFGMLRVLNDDTIAPRMGFKAHPHENMEIVTIPLQGTLEHRDNMGNRFLIEKGDVQIMSAGTGIVHSENNPSSDEPVSLLQIWILPAKKNIAPRYEQRAFAPELRHNQLQIAVSPEPDSETLWINQRAYISLLDLDKETSFTYTMQESGQGVYLFVVSGALNVAGEQLRPRDAIGLWEAPSIHFQATSDASLVLLEVPMH